MAFYALRYRESIKDPAVQAEMDDMIAHYNHQLASIMNANGQLLSEAIAATQNSDVEDEQHWWRNGPWTFDDPSGGAPNRAILEADLVGGTTFNNYDQTGLNTAFGLEIGVTGGSDISFTGLMRPNPLRRRLLLFINQDGTRSINLIHGSTSSADGNRFALPNSSDMEILPQTAVMLFYTLERNAWTVVGGSGGGGAQIYTIGITVDGAGSNITTGTKGYVTIPIAGTITRWTLLSTDASASTGNVKMDVYADVYANYPPTSGDSIIGAGTFPELTGSRANTDATVDWNSVTLNVGDVVGFAVHSGVTPTLTRITMLLEVTPS
jgi:hypothetical protein